MRARPGVAKATLALVAALVLACAASAADAQAKDAQSKDDSEALSKILGDWAGESVCVGYRPACRDERVVYHVKKKAGEADALTLAADKIVDGKPEEMYALDFKYDASKHTLTGEFTVNGTHGVWEFEVKGEAMEGTLKILPEGKLARRVKVSKVTAN
jgi:hypothetical protein